MPSITRVTAIDGSLSGSIDIDTSANPRALLIVCAMRGALYIDGVTLDGSAAGSAISGRESDQTGVSLGRTSSAWLIEEADLPTGGSSYPIVLTLDQVQNKECFLVIEIDDFGSIEDDNFAMTADGGNTVSVNCSSSSGSLQISAVHGEDGGTDLPEAAVEPSSGATQSEIGDAASHPGNIEFLQAGQSSSSGTVTHSWTPSEQCDFLGAQIFSIVGASSEAIEASIAETFSLTGTDALTANIEVLGSIAESFSLTGTDALTATIDQQVTIAEAFSLTGTDSLTANIEVLAAIAEAFTLTGTDALTGEVVSLDPVEATIAEAFTLTGTDTLSAQLDQLAIIAESFALTGTDSVTANVVSLDPVEASIAETFSLTGTDAVAGQVDQLTTIAESFALTGTDAATVQVNQLATIAEAFSLTGTDAVTAEVPSASPVEASISESFSLTGTDSVDALVKIHAALAEAFSLTGTDSLQAQNDQAVTISESFTLTGTDSFTAEMELQAQIAEAFSLVGTDSILLQTIPTDFDIATLKEELLPVLDELRSIAGTLGFRPYAVQQVRRTGGDIPNGIAPSTEVLTAITVADGYAPRCKWLSQKDYARGAALDATLEIGPITPAYNTGEVSGGYTFNDLEDSDAPAGAHCFFRVYGEGFPAEGGFFQKVSFSGNKTLGYFIQLKRAPDGLATI